MTRFEYDDDDVVVVVGSGAGGGTMANELCQRGFKVVVLEAGPHLTGPDYHQDEWPAFNQMAWTDPRTASGSWKIAEDFPGLPAWIVKAVGGTTTHWAGACPRFKAHELATRTTYGDIEGGEPAGLADLAGGARAVLRQGRDQDGRDPSPRAAAAAGQQQLQGPGQRRRQARLPHDLDRPVRHERRALRRPPRDGAGRVQLPG